MGQPLRAMRQPCLLSGLRTGQRIASCVSCERRSYHALQAEAKRERALLAQWLEDSVMPARKTAAKKRRAPAKRANRAKRAKRTKAGKKWSARVMRTSDALDLESGIFKKRSA